MSSLIMMLLTAHVAGTVPNVEKEEISYFEVAEQAIFNCPTYKNNLTKVKPSVVFDLVGIERKFRVPSELRGMMLAHACTHSGLDGSISTLRYWRTDKDQNKVKTIFDLADNQKLTRFNRFQFQRTADVWMRRVVKGLDKNKKRCLKGDESCSWINAWLNSVKKYKKSPKKEYKLLKTWHQKIKERKQPKRHAACNC